MFVSINKPVSAQETQSELLLTFSLTAQNGECVISTSPNDLITVNFYIINTSSNNNYTLKGFQNYIHYDLNFFELVEDSVQCYDVNMAVAKKVNSITYGEVIQCENIDTNYNSNFLFCSFKLKVIATTGSGTVYNDEVYAIDNAFKSVAITKRNLTVSICKHDNLTKINKQEPSCTENGWEAYNVCDDCGILFNENSEYVIDKIPYIAGGHKTNDKFVTDNNGHWHACENCNEKIDYVEHTLSKATCVSKAKCEVCGLSVGEIDPHNHKNTRIDNYVITWFFGDGYSGDVYCLDCNQTVKTGEIVSKFNINAWPWWILLISIPIFPVIIIVWLIFF